MCERFDVSIAAFSQLLVKYMIPLEIQIKFLIAAQRDTKCNIYTVILDSRHSIK